MSTPEDPNEEKLDAPPEDDAREGSLALLVVLAIAGGALTGLIGGLFRLALSWCDTERTTLLEWARGLGGVALLAPIAVIVLCAVVARAIVRWAPEASGSGVQRVEAEMRSELAVERLRIIPAKWIGGVLAIGGAGLALGREGPTVQMGATIGNQLAYRTGGSDHDRRTLTAALAGAGLGVAFSAPLAGAAFTFEEVAHAFRTRLVIATVLGCGMALAVAHWLVGTKAVLPAPYLQQMDPFGVFAAAVLGIILGLGGVYYNRLVLRLLTLVGNAPGAPELKAGVVGLIVAVIGLLSPNLIGDGDVLTDQILLGELSAAALALVLAVRWLLGPVSYSVGTPGGLFAPLLLVGATVGALAANGLQALGITASVTAFAIVGMSTFFTAVVRAPVTGVLVVAEMTATTALMVPMLVSAAMAMITATLVHGEPIYDTLRHRMLAANRKADPRDSSPNGSPER